MPSKSRYHDADLEDAEYWPLQESLDGDFAHPDHEMDAYTPENSSPSYSKSRNSTSNRPSLLFLILLRIRRLFLPPGLARFVFSSSSRHYPYHSSPFPRVISGRKARLRLYSLTFLVALLLSPLGLLLLVLLYGGIPPRYTDVRIRERELPQHHWNEIHSELYRADNVLEQVDDSSERYLRFPDHLWGHGLNNVLQEAMLYALIAQQSNYSFVFEDYVWSHLPLPYTIYDFTLRPTRVPMSAFLGGWMVGEEVKDAEFEAEKNSNGPKSPTYVSQKFSRHEKQLAHSSSPPSTSSHFPAGSSFLSTLRDAFRSATLSRRLSVPSTAGSKRLSDNGTPTRRSISAEYFEHVCPPWKRMEISYTHESHSEGHSSESETTPLPSLKTDADGLEILQWWANRLSREDIRNSQCVVVKEMERRVWDPDFFGTSRILSLYPLLRDSPILRGFQWSSLVVNAVERNMGVLFGSPTLSDFAPGHVDSASRQAGVSPTDNHASDGQLCNRPLNAGLNASEGVGVISGVLAVHLRRGDYSRHCTRLAHWGAGYMGWNRLVDGHDFEEGLQAFLDGDRDPSSSILNTVQDTIDNDARKEAYYLAHCLPTIPQIVHRLSEIRRAYVASLGLASSSRMDDEKGSQLPHHLTQVYILTNGWPSFVDDLRTALMADGWERVVASTDLENGLQGERNILLEEDQTGAHRSKMAGSAGLSTEEKGVSAAIDMALAERAEVFVGNGFSSLSANIILLRMAKCFPNHSNWML